jgi:hypothetical protein
MSMPENIGVSIALSLVLVSGSTCAGDHPAPRNLFRETKQAEHLVRRGFAKDPLPVCSCKSAMRMRVSTRRKVGGYPATAAGDR